MAGYFWQTFQPRAILFSAVFRLFGGGYSVMNAVVLAAVTDAVPEGKRLVFDIVYYMLLIQINVWYKLRRDILTEPRFCFILAP